jgi:hypothetical protein
MTKNLLVSSNSTPSVTYSGQPPVAWSEQDNTFMALYPASRLRAVVRLRSSRRFTDIEIKLLKSLIPTVDIYSDSAESDFGIGPCVLSFSFATSGAIVL